MGLSLSPTAYVLIMTRNLCSTCSLLSDALIMDYANGLTKAIDNENSYSSLFSTFDIGKLHGNED